MVQSIAVLTSLIEANNNRQILKQLCRLDIVLLKTKLVKEYTVYVKNILNPPINTKPAEVEKKLLYRQDFGGNIEEAFNIYFLLININKYNEDVWYYMKEVTITSSGENFELAKESYALQFYDKHVLSIEILFKNKVIRVFFPLSPIFKHLS